MEETSWVSVESFAEVRLLLTSEQNGSHKWIDTGLVGLLKVIQVVYQELQGKAIPPIMHLRLCETSGICVFDYELSTNFGFEPKLAPMLAAVQIVAG